jgi:hypothetical protein
MPWYSFAAQWPDGRSHDAGTTRLSSHEMARRYARLIVEKLKHRQGHHNSEIKMIIKDGDGNVIHIITF